MNCCGGGHQNHQGHGHDGHQDDKRPTGNLLIIIAVIVIAAIALYYVR
ncbi:MAG: hypothetical protein PWR27_166 [Petroclostridium sp.]|jgi:hypothetical protein|nr:hypothetical protein [Petroclostridium xylanilyticum]MBZ4646624.1 hypothetical protein [Clostridia bacterium]MDK2809457.1 hypothetical protein [Petroclostridium sp.]